MGLSHSYKVEVRYLGEKNIEHIEQYVKKELTITLSCEKHMSEERKDLSLYCQPKDKPVSYHIINNKNLCLNKNVNISSQ